MAGDGEVIMAGESARSGAEAALRLAGILLFLTGAQFLIAALSGRGGAMATLTASGAVLLAVGILCRRGIAAAAVPGLAVSAAIVGLGLWRWSTLSAVAGPSVLAAGLLLPAASAILCLRALPALGASRPG